MRLGPLRLGRGLPRHLPAPVRPNAAAATVPPHALSAAAPAPSKPYALHSMPVRGMRTHKPAHAPEHAGGTQPGVYAVPSAARARAHIKSVEQYAAVAARALADPDAHYAELAAEFVWDKKVRACWGQSLRLIGEGICGVVGSCTYGCNANATSRDARLTRPLTASASASRVYLLPRSGIRCASGTLRSRASSGLRAAG